MIERAINQGWETSPEQQERSLKLCYEVLHDDHATERETLTAIRVITAAVNKGN
ncbi:hypothetical protein [Roseiconus nitratireducens]|uniref:hypothetical protein n=1 Tax=Roseiconus nitratireducens TaxID=2605748 RepID=UPI00137647F5|nr:hypothetical protein [Roseiconus nitratireducens]